MLCRHSPLFRGPFQLLAQLRAQAQPLHLHLVELAIQHCDDQRIDWSQPLRSIAPPTTRHRTELTLWSGYDDKYHGKQCRRLRPEPATGKLSVLYFSESSVGHVHNDSEVLKSRRLKRKTGQHVRAMLHACLGAVRSALAEQDHDCDIQSKQFVSYVSSSLPA